MRAIFDWHGFVQADDIPTPRSRGERQMRVLVVPLRLQATSDDVTLEGNEEVMTCWSVPFEQRPRRAQDVHVDLYYRCAGCFYCDGNFRRRAFEDGKVAGVAEYRRTQRRKISLARRKRRQRKQVGRWRRAAKKA